MGNELPSMQPAQPGNGDSHDTVIDSLPEMSLCPFSYLNQDHSSPGSECFAESKVIGRVSPPQLSRYT